VLLLAAVLSEIQLQRLIGEARLLGLDTLVEVHDEGELKRSIRSGATVIGINNRDLRTFEVNLETSLRLLPLVPPMVTWWRRAVSSTAETWRVCAARAATAC